MTPIILGVAVLLASWLAARLAKITGNEDAIFALSMLLFVVFAIVAILFPVLASSIENNPIFLGILVLVVLFGFMSAWMSQE